MQPLKDFPLPDRETLLRMELIFGIGIFIFKKSAKNRCLWASPVLKHKILHKIKPKKGDVIELEHSTHGKVALLILDTQGIFSLGSDFSESVSVFAISLFLSSMQIYNIRNANYLHCYIFCHNVFILNNLIKIYFF